MTELALLEVAIFEMVVDFDGLGVMVEIFVVMVDVFCVVVGVLVVVVLLLFSTSGKASGRG